MTDDQPAELPPEGEGHDLPGQISDPIRAGEIPAPLKYERPPTFEEEASPVDVVFGSGHGMGAGATRRRDGTIPTEASGTDDPRGDHIRAAARLEQALADLRDAYLAITVGVKEAVELEPAAFGGDTSVPAAHSLRWLAEEYGGAAERRAIDAENSRQMVREMLERL